MTRVSLSDAARHLIKAGVTLRQAVPLMKSYTGKQSGKSIGICASSVAAFGLTFPMMPGSKPLLARAGTMENLLGVKNSTNWRDNLIIINHIRVN